MDQKEFILKAREWQKNNKNWKLICDMTEKETDAIYQTFGDLPLIERMSWIGKFREHALKMWRQFGVRKCKVKNLYLNEDMELCDVWPSGQAMSCFELNEISGEPDEFPGCPPGCMC